MSGKYSAASDFNAGSGKSGANAAMTVVATHPAKNKPIAATHRAAPALSLRHFVAVDHGDDRGHL
jgi:hypothetical protein